MKREPEGAGRYALQIFSFDKSSPAEENRLSSAAFSKQSICEIIVLTSLQSFSSGNRLDRKFNLILPNERRAFKLF
ncbi:MAG: hypothetical protein M3264_06305 [Thermoproteota archaeon]|nr:hypothetical protein [Thermoproteota archaeon]